MGSSHQPANLSDNKVEVCLDVSQYEPEELEVKVKDNVVTVLGRQETGSGTGNTNTSAARMFTKSFTLPHRVHPAEVESRLIQDGRLVITAPARKLPAKRIFVVLKSGFLTNHVFLSISCNPLVFLLKLPFCTCSC